MGVIISLKGYEKTIVWRHREEEKIGGWRDDVTSRARTKSICHFFNKWTQNWTRQCSAVRMSE